MVATLNVNPMQTTNAAGSFRNVSDGFIQGIAMDDPAIRNELAGGVLSSLETLPMWGGVGISELIAPPLTDDTGYSPELGNLLRRAAALDGSLPLTGFSVFDQAHSMINTPQSKVPLALANMSVHFYRLGSGIRIPVKCAPQLVSLFNSSIISQVSWDFTSQQLVPFSGAYASSVISNAVWANTGGGQVTFTVANDLTSDLSAGDVIDVQGVVNTGGASTSAFNGAWKVKSVTSTTVVVEALASASIGTYASGGEVVGAGGALPVKVLTIRQDNCMTVTYDPVTGFANWNQNDAAALIQI